MRIPSILLLLLAAAALAVAGDDPPRDRAWLGVVTDDALDGGVRIVGLAPGGPAERAGLAAGDVLVRARGAELPDQSALTVVLEQMNPGQPLDVLVLREGQTLERQVKLGSRRGATWIVAPEPPVALAPPVAIPLLGGPAAGLATVELTQELRRHYGAPADSGVLVTRVTPGSPAADAGFEVGDVVVEWNGSGVASVAALSGSRLPERAVVVRKGERRTLTGTTPASPEPPTPAPQVSNVERALVEEIERLQERIRVLERSLERLRERR